MMIQMFQILIIFSLLVGLPVLVDPYWKKSNGVYMDKVIFLMIGMMIGFVFTAAYFLEVRK